MKNRYKIIIVVLVLGFLTSTGFLLLNWYDNANFSKMSLEQALQRKQFKVEVRRGAGQFEIKPFKFAQLHDDKVKVYFRNEGRREVGLTFFNYSEHMRGDNKGKEPYTVKEKFAAGEEKELVLKRDEKANPDDEYMLAISDPTEPYPVVLGEFMIYTGDIIAEPSAVGKK